MVDLARETRSETESAASTDPDRGRNKIWLWPPFHTRNIKRGRGPARDPTIDGTFLTPQNPGTRSNQGAEWREGLPPLRRHPCFDYVDYAGALDRS